LLSTFFPISGFFIIIFALTEFFWRLPDFITFKPQTFVVIKYLSLHIPLWFVQTLPMTTMLSTLLVLSHFIYTKELVAIKTLGIDLKKFFISWLIFGLMLCFISFYINDKIATKFFKTAQNIFKTEIKKETVQENVFYNLTYSDTKNVFATIDIYDKTQSIIKNVIIEQLDPEYNLINQIFSPQGNKKNGTWILNNAVVRNFKNNILVSQKYLGQLKLPLEIDVEDFQYDYSNQPLDQLSIKELKNIIKISKLRGLPTEKYLTELGFRFALPTINFILILLSISLGQTTSTQYGKLVSFVYTILAIIIYWTLLSIFRNIGEVGIINPIVSIWIPNFIFLFFGVMLYFRKRQ
jgi:LPS export ABC transporter permease LptG